MDDDARFWRRVERYEESWTGTGDDALYRRRMKKAGFDDEIINERLEAMKEQDQ